VQRFETRIDERILRFGLFYETRHVLLSAVEDASLRHEALRNSAFSIGEGLKSTKNEKRKTKKKQKAQTR